MVVLTFESVDKILHGGYSEMNANEQYFPVFVPFSISRTTLNGIVEGIKEVFPTMFIESDTEFSTL